MKNFEKYKTAKERVKAHFEWCRAESVCRDSASISCAECAFKWLDHDAERATDKEMPMPCPFCGDRNIGSRETPEGVSLICICGYSSGEYHTVEEAIANHNRICRAVKAAKEGEVR